jgi:3-hydroxyisobutyrate dehydrogenase-like beta-hydroxyacid dehydrogenase
VTGDDRDEAIAFGQTLGLDMGTMLQVLNHSSGRSSATTDKFPHHVLTGRYASGFTNELMTKDVDLYLSAVEDLGGGPSSIGTVTASVWKRFATAEPGADFTRIFPSSRVQDVLVLTIKTSLWIE